MSIRELRTNDKIRVRDVRLIGNDGEQLGIVATIDAIRMAQERGLDLVEVAPNAVPPVCRLMDYGRFKYEQTKREREARKNQKVIELKEVRLTPRTDEHDITAKVKMIGRFLEEGDKVKVTIRFRGRELAHPQLGREVLDQVAEHLRATSVVERPPLMEGRAMFMILSPPGSRAAAPGRPTAANEGEAAAPRPVGEARAAVAAAPAQSAATSPRPVPVASPARPAGPVAARPPAPARPTPANGVPSPPRPASRPPAR
ncbi:MAG: translation initiation factor IF-3 [Chloroflexi bacterium]|nr:translation initiation factor IF-3 [Chloroflexota bacterium]